MAAKQTKTPKVGWVDAHVLCREFMTHGFNLLFTGPPGIGKTDLVKTVAKELGYNLIIFHPVVSDPTDFKGLPNFVQLDNGDHEAVFIPFDQFKELLDAKGPTICFLDDLGQAAVAVQAAAMQLLHGGSLNAKKISPEVRFIACTNRKQDRAGVSGILEPVKSRFHGIFELVPEIDPFVQWLINNGGSPVLVAFMRNRPEHLTGGPDGWSPDTDIVNQPCPRTIAHLNDIITLQLPRALRGTAYSGAVGEGMGNEYVAFESLALSIPDIDVILKNPHGAQPPSTNEIAYAMVGALHTRMNRKNLANIFTYIDKHFVKELQAVFFLDIENYQPSLMETPAYINWAKNNGDLLTN